MYVLSVEDEGRLAMLASPLEAHQPHTITFNIAGMDKRYGNLVFAALDQPYLKFGEEHKRSELFNSVDSWR